MALLAAPALARDDPPRVDAPGAAEGSRVVISELDAAAHPDMRVFATILRDGIPVTGLGAGDFRVREDEVDQRPLTVEARLPPLSVVLAIDASGSMADAMGATREAAARFVDGLGEGDAVRVLRFAREVETPTSMTTTKGEARAAIEALSARGDTALHDALARSVELLSARPGRTAVVVLSDGLDDDGTGGPLSEATVAGVLAAAEGAGVPIFAVGLGTEMDEAVLREVAERTGGLYLPAPTADELGSVYERIGDQLSGQYAIAYTSSLPADGTERRLDLEGPDGRDSRTYAPEGPAPPQPEGPAPPQPEARAEAAPEGCAPVEAVAAVEADLVRAQERYDGDLIDVVQRNAVRDEAVEAIEAAALDRAYPYECMVEAMTRMEDLHDRDLVDIVQRNRIRDHLARPLGDTCAGGRASTACGAALSGSGGRMRTG